MEGTQDNSPTSLAPIHFPEVEIVREIARIWGVKYIYDKEDDCETMYGIAWKHSRVTWNCWIPERYLAPNSPAQLEEKYTLDVASRKILFQKQTRAGSKRYWIHWEGNGDPWCEWWEEDKVSIFAPDLACQMESAPDFGVGQEASLDEDMDSEELKLELCIQDRKCPTTILCWVDSIFPEISDVNAPNDVTAYINTLR